MMVRTYNPSTPEKDAGGSRDKVIYPQLYCEFKSSLGYTRLFEKQTNKKPKQETKPSKGLFSKDQHLRWSSDLCIPVHTDACVHLSIPKPPPHQLTHEHLLAPLHLSPNRLLTLVVILIQFYKRLIYVCVVSVGGLRGQETDPLEMKLQVFVSLCMGVGI